MGQSLLRAVAIASEQYQSADLIHLAWVWSRVGQNEKVVELMERAYVERSLGLVLPGVHPDFATARKDPRIQKLLTRMGLEAVER